MSTNANINFYGKELCINHDGDPERVLNDIIIPFQDEIEKYREDGLTLDEALAIVLEDNAPAPAEPYQWIIRGSFGSPPSHYYRADEKDVYIDGITFQWEDLRKHGFEEAKEKVLERKLLESLLDKMKKEFIEGPLTFDDSKETVRDKVLSIGKDLINSTKDQTDVKNELSIGGYLTAEEREKLEGYLESVVLDSYESMDTGEGLMNALKTHYDPPSND